MVSRTFELLLTSVSLSEFWSFFLHDPAARHGKQLLVPSGGADVKATVNHQAQSKRMSALMNLVKHPVLSMDDFTTLLESCDDDRNTFLHEAAKFGGLSPEASKTSSNLIETVLEKFGETFCKDHELMEAPECSRCSCADALSKLLLMNNNQGNTFLHEAAKTGSFLVKLIEKVLEKFRKFFVDDLLVGDMAEVPGCSQRSRADHLSELLLETNNQGNTFLHEAAKTQNFSLELMKKIQDDSYGDFCQGDHLSELAQTTNKEGNTFLHEAAKQGSHLPILLELIMDEKENFAQYVNLFHLLVQTNNEGSTFLHEAAKQKAGVEDKDTDILPKLVKLVLKKADSNKNDRNLDDLFKTRNKQGHTFLAAAKHAGVDDKTIVEVVDTMMKSKVGKKVMRHALLFNDSAENSLLHLASTEKGKGLVSCLRENASYLLEERNSRGFAPTARCCL